MAKNELSECNIPPLASLYVFLSWACNLRCRHCWARKDSHAPSGELTADEVINVIEQGRPLGLSNIKLSGGEPMLNKSRFLQLIRYFRDTKLNNSIESNGTLIDEEIAEALKEANTVVAVSIDAAEAELHDKYRGVVGSHDKTTNGLKLLRNIGVRCQILTAVAKDNLSQIEAIVRKYAPLGVSAFGVNAIQPSGQGIYLKNIVLNELEILELSHYLDRLSQQLADEKNEARVSMGTPPLAFKKISAEGFLPREDCPFGHMLSIIPDGTITVCGCFDHTIASKMRVGSINDDIAALWKYSPALLQIRSDIPCSLEGICSRCLVRDYCQGSCRALAIASGGRVTSEFPFCAKMAELGKFPKTRLRDFISNPAS